MSDSSAGSEIITPNPPNVPMAGARPYWFPDTRGFLSAAIVMLVFIISLVVIMKPLNIDDRGYQLLTMILGIIIATFKDVYSFSFNSTQQSEDKTKTIEKLGTALGTSVPTTALPTIVSAKE